MSLALPAALAAISIVVALALSAGMAGVLYSVFYLLAVLPGLPIGFAVFGRRQAAGWVTGALVGYGLTQLTLWGVIASGAATGGAFVAAWAALGAVTWIVGRSLGHDGIVAMPRWTPADSRALLLTLLLVPALMAPPYRNLGREDAAGRKYYRAYFTADFVWHAALASELGKFTMPPRNPYLAPRPVNYYWTYFLLPAAVAELAPSPAFDVERCLESNAILTGVLMIATLFLLTRTAVTRAGTAALAVSIAVLAASVEGLYAIFDVFARGAPWIELLDTNVDAISNWSFGGMRIDNIPRSLWYTPQHTMSIALGMAALLVPIAAGVSARLPAIGAAGLMLGLATTMNPLLGGVCAALYGISVTADALAIPQGWKLVPRHLLAAVTVAAAVGWGIAGRVVDGAGSALEFGLTGMARRSPFITILLSLGPVLVPGMAGLRLIAGPHRRPVTLAVAGVATGLFLLYFVRISEASWVGFRAGQLLLVFGCVLLGAGFETMPGRLRRLLAVLLFAVGLPTTALDTWNAQDIGNHRPGPGFRWTLWTTAPQREAFAWLQAHTKESDIVQMEPTVRGREHWSLIPSFAGRRMAAGLPISLLPIPDYEERSGLARTIFATASADEASDIARKMRIDYLYVDATDAAAYPEGTRKFATDRALFERVFQNAEVSIYRVH